MFALSSSLLPPVDLVTQILSVCQGFFHHAEEAWLVNRRWNKLGKFMQEGTKATPITDDIQDTVTVLGQILGSVSRDNSAG